MRVFHLMVVLFISSLLISCSNGDKKNGSHYEFGYYLEPKKPPKNISLKVSFEQDGELIEVNDYNIAKLKEKPFWVVFEIKGNINPNVKAMLGTSREKYDLALNDINKLKNLFIDIKARASDNAPVKSDLVVSQDGYNYLDLDRFREVKMSYVNGQRVTIAKLYVDKIRVYLDDNIEDYALENNFNYSFPSKVLYLISTITFTRDAVQSDVPGMPLWYNSKGYNQRYYATPYLKDLEQIIAHNTVIIKLDGE